MGNSLETNTYEEERRQDWVEGGVELQGTYSLRRSHRQLQSEDSPSELTHLRSGWRMGHYILTLTSQRM